MANFDEGTVREALRKLIPTVDWSAVAADDSLAGAGVDSLDKANLFLNIEELGGVQIADAEYENIDSIDAIVQTVEAKRSSPN